MECNCKNNNYYFVELDKIIKKALKEIRKEQKVKINYLNGSKEGKNIKAVVLSENMFKALNNKLVLN